MNQTEARKLWVEALRSGEYEQGKESLRDGDKYCCLGVACDLYAKHEGGQGWGEVTDSGWEFGYGHTCYLAPVVCDWLGLASLEGLIPGDKSLVSLNDGGAGFKKIADVIESEPLGLFKKDYFHKGDK